MLYSEIIAVCTEIRIKHIFMLCGQKVELPNINSGGTYSYHWAVEAEFTRLVSILLDYLTLHNGTERFSRNVGNYQSTLRNLSEEQRFIFGLKYFSADGLTSCVGKMSANSFASKCCVSQFVYLFILSYAYLLYLMCICCASYVYLLYLMCICCTICVLLFLLEMPDCWLEVSIRKVLRPATPTQVFLGFPMSTSEC